MSDKLSKNMLELVSNQFKILAEPMRLAILQEMKHGEQCVKDLTTSLETSQANISKHLALLMNAGMVSRRKVGLKVYYKISSPTILEMCQSVCEKIENDFRSNLENVQ